MDASGERDGFIDTISRCGLRLREDPTLRWVVFGGLVLALIAPTVIGVATYNPVPPGRTGTLHTDNVTFVSTQGTSTHAAAGVYAVKTDSKKVLWSFTKCPEKCFDVDPLSNDTVLFVGKTKAGKPWDITNASTYNWKATHMNWRTGEVIARFSVPIETHDVDYLGDGKYVVANKVNHDGAEAKWVAEAKRQGWIDENRSTHSHLIYIYDRKADEITWEYRFVDHYPRNAGDGYENDYTHLNDVDVVRNGSAFLASPREFDRVVLINRSEKEVEWELGEEDAHDVLHEQHNPTLLSLDPPTVLVADSENDRIIEYQRVEGEWKPVWTYSANLNWPRDADRLPNGNTLIIDTGNDRVLEVTPDKRVVWKFDIARAPYDVERLQHGDEPRGPTMNELGNPDPSELASNEDDNRLLPQIVFAEYYSLAQWILPPGVDVIAFVSLHGAIGCVLVWIWYERAG